MFLQQLICLIILELAQSHNQSSKCSILKSYCPQPWQTHLSDIFLEASEGVLKDIPKASHPSEDPKLPSATSSSSLPKASSDILKPSSPPPPPPPEILTKASFCALASDAVTARSVWCTRAASCRRLRSHARHPNVWAQGEFVEKAFCEAPMGGSQSRGGAAGSQPPGGVSEEADVGG